jgi:hypothetical protein
LLADDARALHFFDMVEAVRDDPVPADQLNWLNSKVRDADGILENPLALGGTRVFRGMTRQNFDANRVGQGV